jgi:hypothetical protein
MKNILKMLVLPIFIYATAPIAQAQKLTFNLDSSMPGSFGKDSRILLRVFDKEGKLLSEFIDFDATQSFTVDFGQAEYFTLTEHRTGIESRVSLKRNPNGPPEIFLSQERKGFDPATIQRSFERKP